MTIYSCAPEWEAMLTCIYVASSEGKGHNNIRLELEPVEQYSLFDEYVHVDVDYDKARKVIEAVCNKISPYVYNELAYCSMAYEPDVLDNIYRIMLLGFKFGPNVLDMVQYRDVMRNVQIRKRVGTEAHHFREFIRFHEVRSSFYVAHIEPKSRIVAALGHPFMDRMPSEYWMIVDDVHMEAVIHPKNQPYYIRKLNKEELDKLLLTEQENDAFTDLWQVFFEKIAIKERENARCQRNLFPIWTRKHAVEFI